MTSTWADVDYLWSDSRILWDGTEVGGGGGGGPVAGSNVASVFNGSDLNSYATGSYTPNGDRLLIAAVHNRGSGSGITPDIPTLSGNGLTWSELATYLPDATGTMYRITIFVAKSGSSPSAGAVTASFGGVTQGGCVIVVDEFSGADLTGTALAAIAQHKTGATSGAATSHTITLDTAIGSGNATYGTFMHETSELSTPGSGYTELADNFPSSGFSIGVITEYRADGQTAVNASWTTSIQYGGIALEIKVATGGGDTTPPTNPTSLQATAINPNRIDLSWVASTDNVGVTGYEIWRDGSLLASIGNVTSYSDTSCAPSTAYSYQVKARDAAGNISGFSNTANATTPSGADTTPPTVPTGLIATAINANRIDLSWNASSDNVAVTQYRVYRNSSLIQTIGAVTTFQDTTVSPSTTYTYQVRAGDAANNFSGLSSSAQATTPAAPDTTPPSNPTGLGATAINSNQIDLAWTASTDNVAVTGYDIYRGGSLLTSVGAVIAFSDTSVVPSTAYSYQVKAKDAAGNISGFSNTANATTPAAPVIARDMISWFDPAGVETVLSYTAEVKHLKGQDGRYMPPVDLIEEEVPFQPGARTRTVRIRSRNTFQPLLIESTTPQLVRTRLRALARSFNPARGEGRLRIVGHDGISRELYCRYASGLGLEERQGVKGRLWQRADLEFHANDPFWYDSAYTTQVFSLAGSPPQTYFPMFPLKMSASEILAEPTINNGGDADAWPEWVITGPGSEIIMRNLTTGKFIEILTSLLAGETITIDTRPGKKTVKRQDGSNLYGVVAATSSLWPLVPGNNVVRIEMSGAGAGTQAALNFKRRWLSI